MEESLYFYKDLWICNLLKNLFGNVTLRKIRGVSMAASELASVKKTAQEDFVTEGIKKRLFNLPGRIESDLTALAERYGISKIVLFGSRARGDNGSKSDVDIAVFGCNDFSSFSLDVDDEVQTLLKFDIVNMDEKVSDELRGAIQRDGVVIYEKI